MSFLTTGLFPVVLTLACFYLGRKIQAKWKSPLLNPTLLAAILAGSVLLLSGMDVGEYRAGNASLSGLMTPATIALAIPMYEQFQALKKNWSAILIGVASGIISCLFVLLLGCLNFKLGPELTISLLPKSVTTAIGAALGDLFGGMESVTTAAIIASGIMANIMGPALCKLLHITHPLAKGVALGTSGHVIGTARANELGPLTGAVSSLSLVTAGILMAVLMPWVVKLV